MRSSPLWAPHLDSRGDEMGAAAPKQPEEVTSRAIDVLDPRQVEVELAITAHRVGCEPGFLQFVPERSPSSFRLIRSSSGSTVILSMIPSKTPDTERGPKAANAMPRSRPSRSLRKS